MTQLKLCRDGLLEKEKISKKADQDYRMVLNSAYYTYITHDAEFEKQMLKVLKVHGTILQMLIQKASIPELKLDPLTMNPILFEEFYNRLDVKYVQGLAVPSLI